MIAGKRYGRFHFFFHEKKRNDYLGNDKNIQPEMLGTMEHPSPLLLSVNMNGDLKWVNNTFIA